MLHIIINAYDMNYHSYYICIYIDNIFTLRFKFNIQIYNNMLNYTA